MYDLVVRNGRMVIPEGLSYCDLAVDEGVIVAVGSKLKGRKELNADGLLVLPGVVDAHVHMALPVRGNRSSDDFLSGSMAAAAGGVTSMVDFTVGSPRTDLVQDIDARLETAEPSVIDYGFHCEMVGWTPGRENEIPSAVEKGVTSFKFFTAYGDSGRRSDSGALYRCFSKIAETGAVAVVHAEDDDLIRSLTAELSDDEKSSMTALSRTRPDICEGAAIDQAAFYGEVTGASVHVVHVSSALGASRIEAARMRGLDITAETCPQYLYLTDQVYRREDGHLYSASPALRGEDDGEYLWGCLGYGALDFVATDHCPFTSEQKAWKGSFSDLPYGLPGVETSLPLIYSGGVATGRIPLEMLPVIMSQAPAERYGLKNKGRLAPGYDGDLVLFDPGARWTARAEDLHMKVDFSPYEGMEIQGRVITTVARGEIIYSEGRHLCEPGRGKYLFRNTRD
ncbi:MAG: amidohydrolase family protein [Synergistota bacterium]|nr:amidohydrolase family protein [Synergistota bacterium]